MPTQRLRLAIFQMFSVEVVVKLLRHGLEAVGVLIAVFPLERVLDALPGDASARTRHALWGGKREFSGFRW